MIARATAHLWGYRVLFVALCLVIMAYKLLPFNLSEAGIPAPDLLIALTFAWLLRQPALVPIGSIVLVFLLADLLFQRPPGLWTLLVLLGAEVLRRRRAQLSAMPFAVECAAFAGGLLALLILERLALWILMIEQASLGLVLTHGLVTIVIYPFVVGISKFLFGVRKLRPIEAEVA